MTRIQDNCPLLPTRGCITFIVFLNDWHIEIEAAFLEIKDEN
jgi:hypothetical protein